MKPKREFKDPIMSDFTEFAGMIGGIAGGVISAYYMAGSPLVIVVGVAFYGFCAGVTAVGAIAWCLGWLDFK